MAKRTIPGRGPNKRKRPDNVEQKISIPDERSIFRPGHVEMRSVEFTDESGSTLRLTVEAEYHPKTSLPWAGSIVRGLSLTANDWQERLAKQLLEHGKMSTSVNGTLAPMIRELKFSGGK